MKRITKLQPPQELIAWTHDRAGNNHPINRGYNDMPTDVRQAVKDNLLREQGGLCCYTGRRITFDTSHIEHLKPQDICENHEDTEYRNLLAAYPSANAQKECAYGAHCKKNWYDHLLFVDPLRQDCEFRFRYKDNGKVTAADPEDTGAITTIDHLNLDDKELRAFREAAIHSALFEDRLTRGQVQRLHDAMDQRNADGLFREYCFAIKQACERHLRRFGQG